MSLCSNLLTDYQLVALNAWTSTLGATSHAPTGSSRIDFMLVRHGDADTQAKQVGLLDTAPFVPSGAHHLPVITSFNYKTFHPNRARAPLISRQVKQRVALMNIGGIPYIASCVKMGLTLHCVMNRILLILKISMKSSPKARSTISRTIPGRSLILKLV